MVGVFVRDAGSSATLVGCSITDCHNQGLVVAHGATVLLEQCEVARNQSHGVRMCHGARGRFFGCKIDRHDWSIDSYSNATIDNNLSAMYKPLLHVTVFALIISWSWDFMVLG